MGWLPFAGSIQYEVSVAKEFGKKRVLFRKRPGKIVSLLFVATPYVRRQQVASRPFLFFFECLFVRAALELRTVDIYKKKIERKNHVKGTEAESATDRHAPRVS